MQQTFYFYDLETSGINAREARIMQFAGQRTSMDLEPIGDPHNILIKLTPDILPEPDAIFITGITPQKTLSDGITEAEFLKIFHSEIALSGTIFTGFNSIRFDDEFMRFTNYRNFYDPYEWQWSEGRSKWDILDVSRMTRALRPDGITWPYGSDGKPSNRLELLSSVNKLEHANAHDALSDVHATIAVTKLIQQKQPKLFEYLLKLRDKKEVQKLVSSGDPFVYTSGKYSSEFEKTTLACAIAAHPVQSGAVFVYDLRHDPAPFIDLQPKALAEALAKWKFEEGEQRLPVKLLQYNKCPAVAPQGVVDAATKERLGLNDAHITKHLQTLRSAADFAGKLIEAAKINEKQKQTSLIVDTNNVDAQLYDGFFNYADKNKIATVRAASENELADLHLDFADERLERLLLLYKARQFPKSLTADEQVQWEAYRSQRLLNGGSESRLAKFVARLQYLAAQPTLTKQQAYLLQELQLYAESITPYDTDL